MTEPEDTVEDHSRGAEQQDHHACPEDYGQLDIHLVVCKEHDKAEEESRNTQYGLFEFIVSNGFSAGSYIIPVSEECE